MLSEVTQTLMTDGIRAILVSYTTQPRYECCHATLSPLSYLEERECCVTTLKAAT